MDKIIIGIDYSMTSPAVCIIDGDKIDLYGFINGYRGPTGKTYKTKGDKKITVHILRNVENYKSQIERFDILARRVMAVLNRHELAQPSVWMEGYSMGSKGQVFNIAENTAILKHYLYRVGLNAQEVAPTTVKKHGAGTGRAQKEDMHDAFARDTGLDLRDLLTPNRKLGSPVTDLIDAYYIASYGKEQQANKKNEDQESGTTQVV
jgi:Holliday junction resolvasome RuvABC endonuclease subunit